MFAFNMIVPATSTRIASIEECRPELREIHDYWQKLRGGRTMPARGDVDPADAVRLLPHIMLVDVFPDAARERRYRIRLHGTEQVNYLGSDWTGSFMHEKADRAAADRLCAIGDHLAANPEPWM